MIRNAAGHTAIFCLLISILASFLGVLAVQFDLPQASLKRLPPPHGYFFRIELSKFVSAAAVPTGELSLNTVTDLLASIRSLHLLEPPQLDKVAAVQAKIPEPQALLKSSSARAGSPRFRSNCSMPAGELNFFARFLRDDRPDRRRRHGRSLQGEELEDGQDGCPQGHSQGTVEKREMAVKRFHRRNRDGSPGWAIRISSGLSMPARSARSAFIFAMEFVDGQDLTQMVKQSGPLPVEKATEYIKQAAAGLPHAQEKGLIHRDIKPSNIFVSKPAPMGHPRFVKLLDMGLARMDDSEDMKLALGRRKARSSARLITLPHGTGGSSDAQGRHPLRSLFSSAAPSTTSWREGTTFDGGSATEKLLKHRLGGTEADRGSPTGCAGEPSPGLSAS